MVLRGSSTISSLIVHHLGPEVFLSVQTFAVMRGAGMTSAAERSGHVVVETEKPYQAIEA